VGRKGTACCAPTKTTLLDDITTPKGNNFNLKQVSATQNPKEPKITYPKMRLGTDSTMAGLSDKMLSNKTALVTGASRAKGIGQAIALELAQAGANIFITYFRPYDAETGLAEDADEAQHLLATLNQMGVKADGLELDLADPLAPGRLFDRVEASLGMVDVLVNNATYSMREDGVENLTAEFIDKHVAVNVRGMMLLCAEFVRRYKQHKTDDSWGRIINLSSGQSVGPMAGELAYAATKGAVEAFTVSLSAEVAPLAITVNAVDPGITDTGWIPPDLKTRWNQESPMGRVGTPQDAARIIRFLASEDAGWLTGQIIHSRGGM
jgi:3-oxoacyl-[acyl-carrier protein] reductase